MCNSNKSLMTTGQLTGVKERGRVKERKKERKKEKTSKERSKNDRLSFV